MCKHENQQFVGETIEPEEIYWCPDCGALICGTDIDLPKLANKPSTTTNEQPTTEQIDNALDCLHGDNSCNHSKVINYLNQFT